MTIKRHRPRTVQVMSAVWACGKSFTVDDVLVKLNGAAGARHALQNLLNIWTTRGYLTRQVQGRGNAFHARAARYSLARFTEDESLAERNRQLSPQERLLDEIRWEVKPQLERLRALDSMICGQGQKYRSQL